MVSQNFCGSYIIDVVINDTSDHLPTCCTLKGLIASRKDPIIIKSRDLRIINLRKLNDELSKQNWVEITNDESPSKCMETLHNKLTELVDDYVPERERRIDPKKLRKETWLTAGP